MYVENLTPGKLAIKDEDAEDGTYVVSVTRAELTYFAPELGDTPSGDDKAWLVVTYQPDGEGALELDPNPTGCVLPFTAFTVADDEGTKAPVAERHSTMEVFSSEKTLVFEVPADLTEATLTLAATSFGCQWAGEMKPYTATGQADVSIKLPAR